MKARLLIVATLVTTVLVGGFQTAGAGALTVGGTYDITSVRSGRLVDVYGASKADGEPVVQYHSTGYVNQQWTVRAASGGTVSFANVNSGKCLAVAGAATSPGAAIVQSTCVSGAGEQSFTVSTDGAGVATVKSVRSGLCLDVTGGSTADAATLQQSTCTTATSQQWRFDLLHRIGSWETGVNPGGASFTNQTIREVVHVSAGGTAPRLRLSNLHGTAALAIGHVDLAVQSSGGTAVAGSHHRVTVGGAGTVSIAAGQERFSDPVPMIVATGQSLLVSIYLSGTTGPSSWHPGATDTTYVSAAGDHSGDDGTANYPITNTSWFFLTALDLTSSTATGTLVAFGDSITDGYQSSVGADKRYPDDLARRLAAVTGGPRLGVVNAGIAGNQLLADRGTTYGDSALHRFAHDALATPGVREVLLLEGINDITGSSATAQQIIAGYRTLIAQAHAAGVAVYLATILPFGGASAYTAARETSRETVNQWIRTGGAADGVIDLDAALRDPADNTRMQSRYASGDHLHPNNAGYQAMADAVDLTALRYWRQPVYPAFVRPTIFDFCDFL